MWADPKSNLSDLARAGVVMFALAIPLFAWELIRPDRLVLSPSGLTWTGPWRTRRYSWEQLSEFSVVGLGRWGSKMIGFDVIRPETPHSIPSVLTAGLSTLNSGLIGATGAIPGLWEVEPEEVVDLLNRARSRWAGRRNSAH